MQPQEVADAIGILRYETFAFNCPPHFLDLSDLSGVRLRYYYHGPHHEHWLSSRNLKYLYGLLGSPDLDREYKLDCMEQL